MTGRKLSGRNRKRGQLLQQAGSPQAGSQQLDWQQLERWQRCKKPHSLRNGRQRGLGSTTGRIGSQHDGSQAAGSQHEGSQAGASQQARSRKRVLRSNSARSSYRNRRIRRRSHHDPTSDRAARNQRLGSHCSPSRSPGRPRKLTLGASWGGLLRGEKRFSETGEIPITIRRPCSGSEALQSPGEVSSPRERIFNPACPFPNTNERNEHRCHNDFAHRTNWSRTPRPLPSPESVPPGRE